MLRSDPVDYVRSTPSPCPRSPRATGNQAVTARGSPRTHRTHPGATKLAADGVRALALNPTFPTLSYLSVYTTRTRIYVVGCSEEPPGYVRVAAELPTSHQLTASALAAGSTQNIVS